MPVLPKGANAPLNGSRVDAVLEWTESGGVAHDVDLCGLLLGADGRVRDDADFVFYNQPSHPSGGVVHQGRTGTQERLAIDLDQLPDEIEKVVLVSAIATGTFGDVKGLAVSVVDVEGDGEDVRFDAMGATAETAFVVGELYKRSGKWKFRAVGQGWDSGLSSLATNFGVSIAAPPDPSPAAEADRVESPAPEVGPEPAVEQPVQPEVAEASAPATTPPPYVGPAPSDPVDQAPVDPAPGSESTREDSTSDSAAPDWPTPQISRRRLPRATSPVGTPSLDGEPLQMGVGQEALLLRNGQTPERLFVRVTHTSAESAVGVDVSVLAYDEYGEPASTTYFREATGLGGAIRLLPKPTSTSAEDTAVAELALAAIDGAVVGLAVVATSYLGRPLTENASFVVELVTPEGHVAAHFESPAPHSTGTLLCLIRRDQAGAWLLAPVAMAAPGRTGLGAVGAARWALSA